jgi:hypothetical protein
MAPVMPRRPWSLIRTIGRRGIFLVMFGLIYLVVGASVISIDQHRFADVSPDIGPFLDSPLWGIMWIAAGLLAVVVGIYRFRRPPADAMGFGGLLVPPAVWTIFYSLSLLVYLLTGGEFGRATAISGISVWTFVWSVILLVAGWPEAEQRRTGVDDRPGESPPTDPPTKG